MALFQHEDFIILGMLFAKYFTAYIYNFGDGTWGGGSWTGGDGGWIPDTIPEYGTGRGGIIVDESNVNGDDGRPGASDNATGPAVPSLAGGGGKLTSPGKGLNNGGFGLGGNASTTTNGYTISSGGGSGWFGGGSAFLDAGGGGGSNYVFSNNTLGKDGALAAGKRYNPPDWLDNILWVGIDEGTMAYYNANKALYTTNTKHLAEYDILRGELGVAFDDFINYHLRANGNGLILISEPNEYITYDKSNSSIQHVADAIFYSGRAVRWRPPKDGFYNFILWGAQGGTVYYSPPSSTLERYQQFTGGFGGAVGCVISLTVEHKEKKEDGEVIFVPTELYLYVGEMGITRVRNVNAWNGGGNCDGGSTGGGGATDIRFSGEHGSNLWDRNLFDRIAVAGGGGGCIGTGTPNELPTGPTTDGSIGNTTGGGERGEIAIPSDGELPYFLVNDRSIVYVTIKYYTQQILPQNYFISCRIYIDRGEEGVLEEQFSIEPKNGVVEIAYPLDQIYPPNTITHWVTISAVVTTDIMFIIPKNGVTIRVETRADVNEPDSNLDPDKKGVFQRVADKLSLIDFNRIKLTEPLNDMRISKLETLSLIDYTKINILEVEILRIRMIEILNLLDTMNLTEEVNDMRVRVLESIRIIDEVISKLKQDEFKDIYSEYEEKFGITDINNIRFEEIGSQRLSILENLNINDTKNTEEE